MANPWRKCISEHIRVYAGRRVPVNACIITFITSTLPGHSCCLLSVILCTCVDNTSFCSKQTLFPAAAHTFEIATNNESF